MSFRVIVKNRDYPLISKQYITAGPRFVLQRSTKRSFTIEKQVVQSKDTDIPTAFAAVYQRYLCIFLISEIDLNAARFMQYKSRRRSSLESQSLHS